MSNSVFIDRKLYKVGNDFEGWKLVKVTSSPVGQHGEPTIKASFQKGNTVKNIDDMTYQSSNTIRTALGIPRPAGPAMPRSQAEFKTMFPGAASVFGWGGKRRKSHKRKTHRRKSHKRRTHRRRN
jgi:hypothetical protein